MAMASSILLQISTDLHLLSYLSYCIFIYFFVWGLFGSFVVLSYLLSYSGVGRVGAREEDKELLLDSSSSLSIWVHKIQGF